MTQHLFFVITLIATWVFFNSAAEANSFNSLRCEDRAANCVGTCANHGGGVNDNKCMRNCDLRVTTCLIRADERWHRNFPMRAWVR